MIRTSYLPRQSDSSAFYVDSDFQPSASWDTRDQASSSTQHNETDNRPADKEFGVKPGKRELNRKRVSSPRSEERLYDDCHSDDPDQGVPSKPQQREDLDESTVRQDESREISSSKSTPGIMSDPRRDVIQAANVSMQSPLQSKIPEKDNPLSQLPAAESIAQAHKKLFWKEKAKFQGHSDGVCEVAFSTDSKLLASHSYGDTIRLCDITSNLSRVLYSDRSIFHPYTFAFSPNSKLLASGCDDITIQIWNSVAGELLHTLRGHSRFISAAKKLHLAPWSRDIVHSITFSPNSKLLASGSTDHKVWLWDPVAGKSLRVLKGHSRTVDSVAFTSDSKILASGSSLDKTIRLWDPATGEQLHMLETGIHAHKIGTITFSSDCKILASGFHSGIIQLWNPITGKLLQILEDDCGSMGQSDDHLRPFWPDHLRPYWPDHLRPYWPDHLVAFSPDNKLLALGSGNKIRLWDPATGQLLQILNLHSSTVFSIAFSPDSKLLASGSTNNKIQLWDLVPGNLQILKGHTTGVRSVTFSPDGKLLASGSDDKTIRLWELAGE
jgi:WD40 repeat protein